MKNIEIRRQWKENIKEKFRDVKLPLTSDQKVGLPLIKPTSATIRISATTTLHSVFAIIAIIGRPSLSTSTIRATIRGHLMTIALLAFRGSFLMSCALKFDLDWIGPIHFFLAQRNNAILWGRFIIIKNFGNQVAFPCLDCVIKSAPSVKWCKIASLLSVLH